MHRSKAICYSAGRLCSCCEIYRSTLFERVQLITQQRFQHELMDDNCFDETKSQVEIM